jgi:hypothetical protein
MKRILFFSFLINLSFTVFADPMTDKIELYANELGIPVQELQRLVDKYNQPNISGFQFNRSSEAQVIDIAEALFLGETKKLVIGKLYYISSNNCRFGGQMGRTVDLMTISGNLNLIHVTSESLFRIQKNIPVDILLECIANNGRGDYAFKVIEIITR